jgi:hypothetical protein
MFDWAKIHLGLEDRIKESGLYQPGLNRQAGSRVGSQERRIPE